MVKVTDPSGKRLHPTQGGKLAAGTVVQLQGLRLPHRPKPLTDNPFMPLELLKKKAESSILQEANSQSGATVDIKVLHQDANVVVLNKPYNIALDDDSYLGRVKALFPGQLIPVNTLATDETGILVFARNPQSQETLGKLFHSSRLLARPVYWAMTTSVYKDAAYGELYNLQYRGRPDHRRRFAAVERITSHQHLRREALDEGTPAISQWRHLSTHIARLPKRRKLGLYEIAPITLQPHQLRVQLAEQLKTPVIGDWLYAPSKQLGLRIHPNLPLHLHLYQLSLKQADGSKLVIKAPIPPHFVLTMNKFRMFLPLTPKLKRPRFPSNVKRLVDRYIPGQAK